jgi:SAM-dependent methyltransferase
MKMPEKSPAAKSYYDRFLAEHYLWMAGGFEGNAGRNREFFSAHGIRPGDRGFAIDLGAGCGFQSVPLAEAGFNVTAVDFCPALLDEIRRRVPATGIEMIAGDITDFPVWAGRRPELITCMGDTLTHLSDSSLVRGLIRQCHAELVPGGRLVLSFRNYSPKPDDSVIVIPVKRDAERIFLCRLEYHPETVGVTDVLFDRRSGTWERSAGTYTKLRLAPSLVRELLEEAGFRIDHMAMENGMIVFIAEKP